MKIIITVAYTMLWICACITAVVAIWMLSQRYFLLGATFLSVSGFFAYSFSVHKNPDEG